MDQQQLIQLLEKFAAGTITPEEKAEWQQWLPQTDRGTRQQLIDLQKAKETGAITDAEYQTQKARLLDNNNSK